MTEMLQGVGSGLLLTVASCQLVVAACRSLVGRMQMYGSLCGSLKAGFVAPVVLQCCHVVVVLMQATTRRFVVIIMVVVIVIWLTASLLALSST